MIHVGAAGVVVGLLLAYTHLRAWLQPKLAIEPHKLTAELIQFECLRSELIRCTLFA